MSHNIANTPFIDLVFRDDFKEIVSFPDRNSLAREVRFFMAYF
jgi:hypothetical protein